LVSPGVLDIGSNLSLAVLLSPGVMDIGTHMSLAFLFSYFWFL